MVRIRYGIFKSEIFYPWYGGWTIAGKVWLPRAWDQEIKRILCFIHKIDKFPEKEDINALISKLKNAVVKVSSSISDFHSFTTTACTFLRQLYKLSRALKWLKLYDYLKGYIHPVMHDPSTLSSDQVTLSNYESAYKKHFSSSNYLHPQKTFENQQRVLDIDCYLLKHATRDIMSIHNVKTKKLFECLSKVVYMNNFQTDQIKK